MAVYPRPGYPQVATIPTGAIRQTLDRVTVNAATIGGVTSGRLALQAIYLNAGETITNVSFMSGTTAGATLTHTWFALYSAALAQLRVTADDTSAAWNASTVKTLALATPYVVPTAGMYYVGICVVGTTVPTLHGNNATVATANGVAPITYGSSTTGLTTPATAPATAAALTALTGAMWAWVS